MGISAGSITMKILIFSVLFLMVCTEQEMEVEVKIDDGNFVTCTICEAVMTAVDEALVDPANEQAVSEFLLQVCSYLGPNLETMCYEFLAESTDDIIDQLVDKLLDPEEVCTAILACP